MKAKAFIILLMAIVSMLFAVVSVFALPVNHENTERVCNAEEKKKTVLLIMMSH
jgi:hypothetical protein